MKNIIYSCIILGVIALSLSSCGYRAIDHSIRNSNEIEAIKGEDIELRNKLRNKRHRERNRHKDRNKSKRLNLHINSLL